MLCRRGNGCPGSPEGTMTVLKPPDPTMGFVLRKQSHPGRVLRWLERRPVPCNAAGPTPGQGTCAREPIVSLACQCSLSPKSVFLKKEEGVSLVCRCPVLGCPQGVVLVAENPQSGGTRRARTPSPLGVSATSDSTAMPAELRVSLVDGKPDMT